MLCCSALFFPLLHYFENIASRQNFEKSFVKNFITIYYVHIELKVNKSSSLFFNDAIRKYLFVFRYKKCIVRLTEFPSL